MTSGGGLVPADLVRLAALVSFLVATVAHGALAFALFFLVLGGTMLPRALGSGALLDAAYSSVILFGAWAAQLDWYVVVPGLDLVVHLIATGLIAAVGVDALTRLGLLAPRATTARAVIATACLGTTLAVVWELGEWAGHTWIDDDIQVGYDDTIGDLAAGLIGATLAGVLPRREAT